MVPIMKKNTLPPKPLNISAGFMTPKNGSMQTSRIVVTAMFMASVIQRTSAAIMTPSAVMPSRDRPSGRGSTRERTRITTAIASITYAFVLVFGFAFSIVLSSPI